MIILIRYFVFVCFYFFPLPPHPTPAGGGGATDRTADQNNSEISVEIRWVKNKDEDIETVERTEMGIEK
jgi:hypothetical protein